MNKPFNGPVDILAGKNVHIGPKPGQWEHVYLISSSNNAGIMEDEEFDTLTEAAARYAELDGQYFVAQGKERYSDAEANPTRILHLQHFLRRRK